MSYKFKYTAEAEIQFKRLDGTYSAAIITYMYGDKITQLKDKVSDEIIRCWARRKADCCINVTYTKKGEYYDSEEIFIEKGEVV